MISIVVHSPGVVTVTRSPGVFARLFLGRQDTSRKVTDMGFSGWVYNDTGCEVEPAVDEAIEREVTRIAVRDRLDQMVRR